MLTVLLVGILAQTGGLGVLKANGKSRKPSDAPVYVEIESEKSDIQLIRLVGSSYGTVATTRGAASIVVNSFSEECTAPCEATIERPRDKFFLTGDGMTTSEAFSLAGHGESLRLKVTPGSAWMRGPGVVFLSLGLPTAITGGIVWLVDSLSSSSVAPGTQNPYNRSGGPSMSSPAILTLIGAGMMGLSIPLIAWSGTKVEFLPGPSGAASKPVNGKAL